MSEMDIDKHLPEMMASIVRRANEELCALSEDELRKEWYFEYSSDASPERNLYEFSKMLDMHKRRCRQWEEHHHGSSCVVERVRDKYLMPRIREFLQAQSPPPESK